MARQQSEPPDAAGDAVVACAVVECALTVAAPQAAVFEFIAHAEDFPRHMPNVLSVEIVEQTGGRRLTAWRTLLDGAPLNWIEEDTLEPPRRLSYRLIKGDIEHLEGEWLMEEAGQGTLLRARLSYRLGVPIIEEVLGDILREKVRLNLEAMLRAAKQSLEEG
jgi:ribosome-associated toxin RatA of RatAB toxin-antitoxin module